MPFCPVCKFEYRPGIEKCPDCDVELVSELPEEKPEPEAEVNLVDMGSYPSDIQAQEARLALESCGIWSMLRDETLAQVRMFGSGVKVLVREEDAAAAQKVLEG